MTHVPAPYAAVAVAVAAMAILSRASGPPDRMHRAGPVALAGEGRRTAMPEAASERIVFWAFSDGDDSSNICL